MNQPMNNIAIIIITYNRPDDMLALAKNIIALDQKETFLKEVIIVNNNSSKDYSVVTEYIENHKEVNFKYIASSENLGVSKGRNYAIGQATAPLLFMLDDDCELAEKNALQTIHTLFASKPKTGIISLKVEYFQNRQMQINAFPHKQFEKYKNLAQFDTYYFAGGAHVVRKAVMDEVGYYPENFFYGMEEYDLSYRILNAGYTIEYNAGVTMLHKESSEGRQTNNQKLKGMWLNKSIVAYTYLPIGYFISTFVLWSLLYIVKSKFDLIGFLKNWEQVFKIPTQIKRTPLNNTTLQYLNKVEARLWY
jgi:GT2 family glycosyltransferase